MLIFIIIFTLFFACISIAPILVTSANDDTLVIMPE
jgi:hypothetical protein